MFRQSQCLHPCKVPLIPFHLLRNLFCTSLSSCNQHHRFRLDGRAPMSSQTHSHVSLMITFLEPHLGQNSLRRNVSCQSFLILSWHTPLHLLLSAVSYFPWSNQMFKVHSNWHEFLCFWLCWVFIAAVSRGSPRAATHSLLLVAASLFAAPGPKSTGPVVVALSLGGSSSWTRDRTHVSWIGRWFLNHWSTGKYSDEFLPWLLDFFCLTSSFFLALLIHPPQHWLFFKCQGL